MMTDLITVVFSLAILGFAARVFYWLYIELPGDMARERHRDPAAWIIIAFIGSPFLAIFLLWFFGDAT